MATDVLQLHRRYEALRTDRLPWDTAWRDLALHFSPTRFRADTDDQQRRPEILNSKIVDSTGILDMRTLAAGMQGGMTSPARPWFKVTLADEDATKAPGVGAWLDDVTRRMQTQLHRSNFYNAAHSLYSDLGTFGTGLMLETADWNGLLFQVVNAGEYVIDVNDRNEVDTFVRRISMTARQIMQQFETVPDIVRTAAEARTGNASSVRFSVFHAVFPRNDRTWGKRGATDMPYASIYWMLAGTDSQGAPYLLRESGFEEFPAFAPRWDASGTDVYGRAPAMDVLPDSRMIQGMYTTLLKTLHKNADPPMSAAASLESVGLDLRPGGQNFIETLDGRPPVAAQPIQQPAPQSIQYTQAAIQEVRQKIHDGLYTDLFKMLIASDRRQITATEIEAREQEKMILIGPVVERLQKEFLEPLVTDESRALMLQFRDSIRDARIAMGVDAARAAEEGAADAVLFDLRARRASYDFNRPVKEYYDRWMPEVQAALSPLSESRNLYGNELASRFADMPMIEADSTQWFGEGKEMPAIPTEELDAGQKKQLRDSVQGWAKKYFGADTLVSNAERGWDVRITAKGIKDTLHHGFDPLLAKSVPFIPQIIEGGIYLDSIEKNPGLMSHIFANKIRLDGQDYVVGFVLREDENGNRFYDHELTEIINPEWLKPGPALQKGNVVHQTNRGDVMNILRERLGVNDGTGRILFQFIDPARVQATPGVQDVVPVLRRIFHMNTMELDDSKAIVTVPREIGMSGPLTDIYQHDALYELYPELRDIRYEVVPEDRLPGNLAGYSPKNGIIYITTDSEVTPSVIAHEVQHAIQDVDERFDFGLSEEASQEVYSQVEQELKDKLPIERARALAARIQYLSQAHEIQAFDTQNRFELTAEERAKYAPNNPSTYYQRQTGDFSPSEGDAIPRARVTFDATPDGRAVIEFFNAADASSMPHELYHIFRREMAESAARPDAPQRVREDWARIEEFVGAEPGQTWTREMEEKFARAGERFLLEGKAPSPALQSVFERLRQWFMEIYANADAAGLHISPAMREVFNNMFSVPAEEADASFRYAVGDLATREIEREFAGDDARFDAAVQEGDMETVGALAQDAEMNLNETLTIAAQSEPETAGMISEQYAPELAMADVDIVKARQMRDVLREVVACEMGR